MILNEIELYKQVAQPNRNTILWRYMSLDKFINLIYSRKLFFSRLDKFSDKLEGTLPDFNKSIITSEISSLPTIDSTMANLYSSKEEEIINSYRAFTLANCWSKNNAESLAMWKIYLSSSKYGVAIQTTYNNLINSLPTDENDILFGIVQYDYKVDKIQQQTISLLKIPPYSFENEVRAVIFNQYTEEGPRKGKPKHKNGLQLKVDLNILINKIYLSPLSPQWFVEVISETIQKYGYSFLLESSIIKENL